MKKVLKIMLSAMLLCTLLVPFTACGDNTPDPNAEYDILDYFENAGGNTDGIQIMMGSEIPTEKGDQTLVPTADVVVTKITGTAYYNWDWIKRDGHPLSYMTNITTDVFVQNLTFPRDGEISFDFEMTPLSSANASINYSSIPDGVWKAGEGIYIARLPRCIDCFAVRNLKIEFYPA